MEDLIKAHPRCRFPACLGGFVWTSQRGWVRCPVCSELYRRDSMESLGLGPPTRIAEGRLLAAHFDEHGLPGAAKRLRDRINVKEQSQ